jgi:hypothetical protein
MTRFVCLILSLVFFAAIVLIWTNFNGLTSATQLDLWTAVLETAGFAVAGLFSLFVGFKNGNTQSKSSSGQNRN